MSFTPLIGILVICQYANGISPCDMVATPPPEYPLITFYYDGQDCVLFNFSNPIIAMVLFDTCEECMQYMKGMSWHSLGALTYISVYTVARFG